MAKIDIWMPVYIGDYLADTTELSAAEHGAYLLLLMHYWLKKGEIGDDIERLSRVCKADEKTCSFILGYYFTHENGNYKNKRADEEMKNAENRRIAASENGKKGGRPSKNNLEKTHSFSVGNPEKSSSSSSSSFIKNILLDEAPEEKETEEEEPEAKRPKTMYNPNNPSETFETLRARWNSKPELPAFRRLFLNLFDEEREVVLRMLVYGPDKLCEAIENYNAVIDDPDRYGFDTRYAFKSLPNFLKSAERYFEKPREAEKQELVEAGSKGVYHFNAEDFRL